MILSIIVALAELFVKVTPLTFFNHVEILVVEFT